MRRYILPALLVIGLANCANDPRSAGAIIGDALAGFAGPEYLYLRQQQRQQAIQQEREEARQHELEATIATFTKVFEETDNPFEARRQTKLKHAAFLALNPVASQNLDALTAGLWALGGGEYGGAVCYMRGFQFGTAHYDQCVYEVKMESGRSGSLSEPAAPRPVYRIPRSPPVVEQHVEEWGKVYDRSECIGPVVMGRCEGTILPKKAYHPTCYGTWLNGRCTGPMF